MKPTFMGASTKQGYDIAARSREIVRSLIDEKTKDLTAEEKSIVERIVHSTADPEYADITCMSNDFVLRGLEAVSHGKDILTDISMVKAGINRYTGDVKCYINHEKTIELAGNTEVTRAAAAIEVAASEGFDGVVVIGNAPTALWKVMKMVETGSMNVSAVIGVPVGFVGAAESKKALGETSIPHLVTQGPKGGTPVAVAAINSLINISKNQ